MKIVQVVETLDVGGLERLAVDIALAQKAAGHTTAVYCLFWSGALKAELDAAGIPVTEFHKERSSKIAVVRAMASQLRRDRPDIVHGHNPGVHHFAAVAKWMAGVPVCVNTRHSATTSSGIPYQERYFRWVEPLTDQVVFVCDFVRRELEPRLRFPAEKCSVIVNGIPQQRFLARPAAPGSALPRIRFGTIGRLVPAKGHAVLIDAFARIAPELPSAELRIYGYGQLETELRSRIERLGMSGRIELAGRTNDAAAAFQGLDVFVFSSVNEGLPLVILEAMTAGLPIVSTRVGGVPEVAPEGRIARYCEPGDAAGLAAAMSTVAAAPDLAASGAAARAAAVSNFSLDAMNRQYESLFEKLLARNGRRRAV